MLTLIFEFVKTHGKLVTGIVIAIIGILIYEAIFYKTSSNKKKKDDEEEDFNDEFGDIELPEISEKKENATEGWRKTKKGFDIKTSGYYSEKKNYDFVPKDGSSYRINNYNTKRKVNNKKISKEEREKKKRRIQQSSFRRKTRKY